MSRCFNDPMPQCFNDPMPQYLNVSMSQCFNDPMPECLVLVYHKRCNNETELIKQDQKHVVFINLESRAIIFGQFDTLLHILTLLLGERR